MWKYREVNAYDSIGLHDCRADSVRVDGSDLVFDFPDGFWIAPVSGHIDCDRPVKTGAAQLCFRGVFQEDPFDDIDVYKTTCVFGKPVFCRRVQLKYPTFLKMFQSEKYELEFTAEYHMSISSLYQCRIRKKNAGVDAECQFGVTAKSIEYRWNEILYDHVW